MGKKKNHPSWLGSLFEQWLPSTGANPLDLFNRARRAFDGGDFGSCVEYLDKAMEMNRAGASAADPRFSEMAVLHWRARAYRALKDYVRSEADYELVLGMRPDVPGGYIDLASLHLEFGAYAEALATLSRGISAVGPQQSPILYLERGKAAHLAGDYQNAVDDFNIAAYHLSDKAEALYRCALSRSFLGDHLLAIRDGKRAIGLAPGDYCAHYYLGRVLFLAERYREAQKSLIRAAELKPASGAVLSLLGRALVFTEEFERAAAFLDRAVELGAGDEATKTALARSRRGLGLEEKAIDLHLGLNEGGTEDDPDRKPEEGLGEEQSLAMSVEIFETLDEEPFFPVFNPHLRNYQEKKWAAEQALQQYFRQAVRYPERARKAGVEGTVIIEFTVEKSGRLSQFKVVERLGYGCDQEAVRAAKRMNDLGIRWTPGKINGFPVRSRTEVGVEFVH